MSDDLLIDIQFSKGQTLHHQLYQYFASKISQGAFTPDTRLPASRRLATELKISRNTVVEVYEQLKAEGYLQARRGSGIFVSNNFPSDPAPILQGGWQMKHNLPGLSKYAERLRAEPLKSERISYPMTVGQPDIDAFPMDLWLRCERRVAAAAAKSGADSVQGYKPLRHALTNYLASHRGVFCDAEQIIITHGAQHGLAICTHALLDDGDTVLMESPGYVGARCAFMARDVTIKSVPVDDGGIQLEKLPTGGPSRLLYTTPTHQYPLGGILSASQRLRLLDWAADTERWIIEDDYDSEFLFFGKPIGALQGMAEQTPVIYLGSFSKTLLPSLRLGYMVVPKDLMQVFAKVKMHQSGASPILIQATAAEFIQQGYLTQHLRRMRKLYQQKWVHFNDLVQDQFAGLATPVAQSAGMHLALIIDGVNDQKLAEDFQQKGFGSTPLSSYYHQSNGKTGLVLGFANTTQTQREQGVTVLRQLILEQR